MISWLLVSWDAWKILQGFEYYAFVSVGAFGNFCRILNIVPCWLIWAFRIFCLKFGSMIFRLVCLFFLDALDFFWNLDESSHTATP